MIDRPVCTECERFRIRKARGVIGYEAFCTAKSRQGRMIDWQYGLSHGWTRRELKDRVESRICPAWCVKWAEARQAAKQNEGER